MTERSDTPGQLVRRSREERGVSQTELALRAGTTQSAISRVEADLVSPTVDYLTRLLTCLGCDLGLSAEPMRCWADEGDLRAWQAQDMEGRLASAAVTLGQLAEIAGTARER